MLQWTLRCMYLFELWFSLGICPGVGLLGHLNIRSWTELPEEIKLFRHLTSRGYFWQVCCFSLNLVPASLHSILLHIKNNKNVEFSVFCSMALKVHVLLESWRSISNLFPLLFLQNCSVLTYSMLYLLVPFSICTSLHTWRAI